MARESGQKHMEDHQSSRGGRKSSYKCLDVRHAIGSRPDPFGQQNAEPKGGDRHSDSSSEV